MQRRAILVRGVVQGVGFRPFVYRLACRLALGGSVYNVAGGVAIEVEGEPAALDQFMAALVNSPPARARVESVSWEERQPRGEQSFCIAVSKSTSQGTIVVSPDVATCDDCLAEMYDPSDRRYLYPFLNCTNCGPRLTIVTGAPYDRERTSMAGFAMCSACHAEYEDPGNRRFHAQPTCCPACGPRLRLLDAAGRPVSGGDPLSVFVRELLGGRIGALKGLGGYHLVCDARSNESVARLRRRKQRDERPFAIMVGDLDAVDELCDASGAERQLLLSPRRPIVLLRKRPGAKLAEEIAPMNPLLGVMLPYTPLHHLLLRAVPRTPLVMTSGNRSAEPIAYEDGDAVRRLAGIADVFLVHDRPIHVRCDDAVTRSLNGVELPLRRSRGYAPEPITLPCDCPMPILAVGGQLKGTFALGQGKQAFLSHHLGDLDHYDAYRAFERDIALYQDLFQVEPQVVVHDLHPDYSSTRYARARHGVRLLAVQHHHAHMASCMAEHQLSGPVIGISYDGAGYGLDGAIWGGEFLFGDYRQFRRAAHFRYVGMPGGEQAVKEPWRMALAHLLDAEEDPQFLCSTLPTAAVRTATRMLERRLNTPLTSSVGRLFDAVAVLSGGRRRVSFEGQAAMELEWLAAQSTADESYPFALQNGPDETLLIDTRPLIHAVARDARDGVAAARIARRFHATLVDVGVAVCSRIRETNGVDVIVLSGGVFMNVLLTGELLPRLEQAGFRVYRHERVPPNDGGLSLGQLAIAAAIIGNDSPPHELVGTFRMTYKGLPPPTCENR